MSESAKNNSNRNKDKGKAKNHNRSFFAKFYERVAPFFFPGSGTAGLAALIGSSNTEIFLGAGSIALVFLLLGICDVVRAHDIPSKPKRLIIGFLMLGVSIFVVIAIINFLPDVSTTKDSQQVELSTPTIDLSDKDTIWISLGEGGVATGFRVSRLKQKEEKLTFADVFVRIQSNRLLVRCMTLRPLIGISDTNLRNVLTAKHPVMHSRPMRNFDDINSNTSAIEIVDHGWNPVFQLMKKKRDTFIIKGIFPASDSDAFSVADIRYMNTTTFPQDFALAPIFKYPSWKFPGPIL